MPTAYLFLLLTVCMWQWINQKVISLKALRAMLPSHKLNKAINKKSSNQPSFQNCRDCQGRWGSCGSGWPRQVVSSNPHLTQRTKPSLQLCTSQVEWACKKLTRGHQCLRKKRTMFFPSLCVHAHTQRHVWSGILISQHALLRKRQVARLLFFWSFLPSLYSYFSSRSLLLLSSTNFINSNFSCIFSSLIKPWKGIGPNTKSHRFPPQTPLRKSISCDLSIRRRKIQLTWRTGL